MSDEAANDRRPRRQVRLSRIAVVGGAWCLLLAGLAGCHSDSSTVRSGTATGNPAAPAQAAGGGHAPGCGLAPASASSVGSILGLDIKDGPTTVTNQTVTECSYTTATFDDVTIRFETNEDAQGFATGKQGFSAAAISDVSGFQDQAYSVTAGEGSKQLVTLVARKGSVEIELISRASLDREKTLEAQLFAALA